MYVSMYVCVPGGALRLKRCVIDSPCSPSAAFFPLLIFAAFVLPALDTSEPPDFSPPFLPPALIASFPFFLNTIELDEIAACVCFKYPSDQIPRLRSADGTPHRASKPVPASRSVRWRKLALPSIRKGQGRPPADYYEDVLLCAYQTNNGKCKIQ